MMMCREKGLCYNCDEKYTKEHKCKAKLLLFLTTEEESNAAICDDYEEPIFT